MIFVDLREGRSVPGNLDKEFTSLPRYGGSKKSPGLLLVKSTKREFWSWYHIVALISMAVSFWRIREKNCQNLDVNSKES